MQAARLTLKNGVAAPLLAEVLHDLGKNPASANKERMVLHAFREMADMKRDPSLILKHEENERAGTDYLL